jgi:hypothetical protein
MGVETVDLKAFISETIGSAVLARFIDLTACP